MRLAVPILGVALIAALASPLAGCHKQPAAKSNGAAIPGASDTRLTPGLWVQTVADRHGSTVTKYCLDASTAGQLSYLGGQLNGRCKRHDMAEAADGSWHFSTSCDMGAGGKVATEGVIKGDFKSHYSVDIQSQTVGAAAGKADGPNRVSADVRRAGDCPTTMKPGDIILPGGARSNLSALPSPA